MTEYWQNDFFMVRVSARGMSERQTRVVGILIAVTLYALMFLVGGVFVWGVPTLLGVPGYSYWASVAVVAFSFLLALSLTWPHRRNK